MERQKRRRVVTAKPSHTGCRTCRIRRVKCDETKPACNRCTSTGRTCDGYDRSTESKSSSGPGAGISNNRQLLPARSKPAILLPSRPKYFTLPAPPLSDPPKPPPVIPFCSITNYERNFFDYFRLRSAFPIWQISPAKDWVQLALQFSLSNETVFQAVAAVGAVNEAIVQISHHSLARPIAFEKDSLALKQYCRASASLRKYIQTNVLREGGSLEPVLLCCFLFVCFEVIAERGDVAFSHLRFGQQVVRDACLDGKNTLTPRMSRLVQHMFDSFAAFAGVGEGSYDRAPGAPLASAPHISPYRAGLGASMASFSIPAAFATVDEAKICLEGLISRGGGLRREIVQLADDYVVTTGNGSLPSFTRYCLAQTFSRCIDLSSHPEIKASLALLLEQHASWNLAIQDLETSELSDLARQTLILLKIQHFESHLCLITARTTREEVYDAYEGDFERVLDLADAYIASLRPSNSSNTSPSLPSSDSSPSFLTPSSSSDASSVSISIPTPLLSPQPQEPEPQTNPQDDNSQPNHPSQVREPPELKRALRPELPPLAEPQKSFTLSPGLLPAVHLIAIKCRSCLLLRRRAVEFLEKVDRREGLYWSPGMGHQAGKVGELEERVASEILTEEPRGYDGDDHALNDEKKREEQEGGLTLPERARFTDVVHFGADLMEDSRMVCGRFVFEERQGAQGTEIELVELKPVLQVVSVMRFACPFELEE